jgi:predicted nucleotidyltransferase
VLALGADGDIGALMSLVPGKVARAVDWMREQHPDRQIEVLEETPDGEPRRVDLEALPPPAAGEAVPPPHARRPPRRLATKDTGILAVTERAVTAVRNEFEDAVDSVILVGSVTREATSASDLDLAVVFRDDAYPPRVLELRTALRDLVTRERLDEHGREVSLWPTRVDHYRAGLPDVSYVRANLPLVEGRLDAWCGLAKHTLIRYESASGVNLFGDFSVGEHAFVRIPRWEAVELFLLATRTLAEGLVELAEGARGAGRNHVAKAGLRAAYAAVLTQDNAPLDSYREIHAAACEHLPASVQGLLGELLQAKTTDGESLPDLPDVLAFMRLCETMVAGAPRLSTEGSSPGRLAESFHFDMDSLVADGGDPAAYRRAPGFETNHYQQFYFLMSAREVVSRLLSAGVSSPEALDFFLEELLAVTSWGLFAHNSGLAVPVGLSEREDVTVWFRGPWMTSLGLALSSVAGHYLRDEDPSPGLAWQPTDAKRYMTCLVLSELMPIAQIPVDHDIVNLLKHRCAADFDRAVAWQAGILEGPARERMLASLGRGG